MDQQLKLPAFVAKVVYYVSKQGGGRSQGHRPLAIWECTQQSEVCDSWVLPSFAILIVIFRSRDNWLDFSTVDG